MVSPVSHFTSPTKGDLIVISLVIAAINQLAIHLLKVSAISAIKNLPLVQINKQSIEQSQERNSTRNEEIVAIIQKYNMCKLCSVVISFAIGAFCLYKELFPLSHLALLGMYIDWKKFAHNRDVIAQLKTPSLTKELIATLHSPTVVTIGINKSSLIQMVRYIFTPENLTTCEETTDKKGIRFLNQTAYNIQSTEIGCYCLK